MNKTVPSNLRHSDVNADLLKKYYDGVLSAEDKNALEKLALDDPFLKDAMEGFEQVPGSFDAYYQKHQLPTSRYNNLYLVLGSALTIFLVSILVIKHHAPQVDGNSGAISENIVSDSLITKEVEIIPLEIDTLQLAQDRELIKVEEVSEAHEEIQKSIDYPVMPENETPILIKENDVLAEEYEIIPEDHNLSKQEFVPASYLFDLFVVDYRRIERERTQISYIKYEFTGTAAEFESEAHEQKAELMETHVDISYWEYLAKAMESFSNGNFKSALMRYQTILEQYPEDFNALFYGGLCFYNLGNFNKALDSFDKILQINLNAFKEEAAWYKVKCQLKLGNKSEARTELDQTIARGGFYVQEAIELRKKL